MSPTAQQRHQQAIPFSGSDPPACVTTFLAALPRPLAVTAAVVSVCSLMGLWLLLRDIRSKVTGEGRTLGSLLGQYAALKAVGWLGKWQRAKLEADTLNVRQAQEETLLSRLRKNAHTLYGKRFDFASIKGEWNTSDTATQLW